jgi:predicted dehydrogenase
MNKPSDVTRRDFLRLATGGTSLALWTGASLLNNPSRVLGAHDRVRVGIIGLHGRGADHLDGFARLKNLEIVALCDVDDTVLRQRVAEMEKMNLPAPKTYGDVRQLLEDQSLDAVSIATPNHWHSLMGIWACQAGKDVYVEKPCSHNLWEGQQLVRAAQKYKRIVQHGTQARSKAAVREGVSRVRDGVIGETYMARGLCFKWRDTIGRAKPEPVPAGVDYELWTGPAPLKPFTRNRFHYNWHWIWDTGNGDLGNQGVHQVDAARWALGVRFPNRVSATGGHFMFDDDQQTPNTLNCSFEFDLPDGQRKMLVFEVRHWITNHEAGLGEQPGERLHATGNPHRRRLGPSNTIGAIIYGSKGYMAIGEEDEARYQTWLGEEQERGPGAHAAGDHYANFIDCVRSRKQEDLNAPIEEGHISAALVHLANASYRLGRSLRFDPVRQQVIGDDEANLMLRGEFRPPFVVPEEV